MIGSRARALIRLWSYWIDPNRKHEVDGAGGLGGTTDYASDAFLDLVSRSKVQTTSILLPVWARRPRCQKLCVLDRLEKLLRVIVRGVQSGQRRCCVWHRERFFLVVVVLLLLLPRRDLTKSALALLVSSPRELAYEVARSLSTCTSVLSCSCNRWGDLLPGEKAAFDLWKPGRRERAMRVANASPCHCTLRRSGG